MMKKSILISALCSLCALLAFSPKANAKISGEWKMHPTFDNSVVSVIDSPERVYFMGYNQVINTAITFKAAPDMSLFYYDKKGDEIVAANQRHDLASVSVRKAIYNPWKGYLLIVYDDYNIDLLHDSGEVNNIAALKNADIPGSKEINFISFDPDNNRVWLATEFGYVCIDDKKYEIAESRNYATPLTSIARLGKDLYVTTSSAAGRAPVSSPRFSLADYDRVSELQGTTGIYPLAADRFLAIFPAETNVNQVKDMKITSSGFSTNYTQKVTFSRWIAPAKNGYLIDHYGTIFYASADSNSLKHVSKHSSLAGSGLYGSWDLTEVWDGKARQGLRGMKVDGEGNYSITHDYMLPNAPNAYISRGMAYHPRYGMLVNSHGIDFSASNSAINEPILLSGLKNGMWTPLSPAYRNSAQLRTGFDPNGLAIDPDNDKYVYMGSPFSGFTRLNLDDPQDILHYSFPGDETAKLPGYVETNPIIQAWQRTCPFSAPYFDANNVMWSFFSDRDDPAHLQFRYLTSEDRKASTNAATARPWKKLLVKSPVSPEQFDLFRPLKSSSNKTLLLYIKNGHLLIYDHNGSLDNTSDDKYLFHQSFTDQDGGRVEIYNPTFAYEDESGIVWLGLASGIYYCQPRNLLQGQAIINRVKVSRNDGTSLADYLLSGVAVNHISVDGAGRKWISSVGGGLVVTSADGRTVYDEFSTDNSNIISNNVYWAQYNPESNSMMVSTDKGLQEFFINGNETNAGGAVEARAYPNPVAPDYYGWVTIDGLPENSLVKIVDAQGNLVRELGIAESGTIQWDVNNLYYKRAKTGVYYVLCSTTEGSGSNVAKILVMN